MLPISNPRRDARLRPSDLITIALLVVLEGLLSADNAMVLAVLVLGLPRNSSDRRCATASSAPSPSAPWRRCLRRYLIQLRLVQLIGGLYLLWLPYQHFFGGGDARSGARLRRRRPWLGLSAFWATVVKVELTDIVFAIDSILVAVAMSPKLWVIITGGLLGILAMRMVIGQLLAIVRRYPALVDGAFVIIAWVGIKLLIEYAHSLGWIHFEVPKWLSLGLIVVIFAASLLYARQAGAASRCRVIDDEANALINDQIK